MNTSPLTPQRPVSPLPPLHPEKTVNDHSLDTFVGHLKSPNAGPLTVCKGSPVKIRVGRTPETAKLSGESDPNKLVNLVMELFNDRLLPFGMSLAFSQVPAITYKQQRGIIEINMASTKGPPHPMSILAKHGPLEATCEKLKEVVKSTPIFTERNQKITLTGLEKETIVKIVADLSYKNFVNFLAEQKLKVQWDGNHPCPNDVQKEKVMSKKDLIPISELMQPGKLNLQMQHVEDKVYNLIFSGNKGLMISALQSEKDKDEQKGK